MSEKKEYNPYEAPKTDGKMREDEINEPNSTEVTEDECARHDAPAFFALRNLCGKDVATLPPHEILQMAKKRLNEEGGYLTFHLPTKGITLPKFIPKIGGKEILRGEISFALKLKNDRLYLIYPITENKKPVA